MAMKVKIYVHYDSRNFTMRTLMIFQCMEQHLISF